MEEVEEEAEEMEKDENVDLIRILRPCCRAQPTRRDIVAWQSRLRALRGLCVCKECAVWGRLGCCVDHLRRGVFNSRGGFSN